MQELAAGSYLVGVEARSSLSNRATYELFFGLAAPTAATVTAVPDSASADIDLYLYSQSAETLSFIASSTLPAGRQFFLTEPVDPVELTFGAPVNPSENRLPG